MQNPYTLTFGKSPTLNISRPEQVNHILDAFIYFILQDLKRYWHFDNSRGISL